MKSTSLSHEQRARVLVEALPYIQNFRGRTMVIKYGGSAMEDPELFHSTLRDVVFLEAVGINPVLVHGGGKAITQRMKEKGVKAQFVAGLRVTDKETVSLVEEVLDGQVNPAIVQEIIKLGGKAQSVRGGSVFQARKAAPVEHEGAQVDIGFVGEVMGCRTEAVAELVHKEIVPVISPLGSDEQGQALNVNADIAAAEMAIALRAFKIIFLSDVNGILSDASDEHSVISTVNPKDVEELKRKGMINGGMIPKVNSCVKALQAGVEKVHLLDGRIPHSLLLELFTDRGIGTEMIR
ncbi:MAG: acetylglutamate kinase [bacterium]